jgi:sec-independent protein translocase protein TatA
MIGPWEIFLILLVVLVIFGAGRLPTIMSDVAKAVKSFKAGLKDENAEQKKVKKDDIQN